MGPPPHPPQGDPLSPRRGADEPAGAARSDPGTHPHGTAGGTGAAPGGGVGPSDLADRARRGDRAAFDALVRHTYADAYALALRLVGDEHDASDAVQDAYLRAYRSIPRFRGESAFSTWLHRIVANCSATVLVHRGRRRHQALEQLAPAEAAAVLVDRRAEHDPEACSERQSDHERLAAALGHLPPRLRSVVVLRDVYDLPHEAIAAELGISVSAAKVRLHRARRQLREQLFTSGHEATAPVDRRGAPEPVEVARAG